MNYLLTFLIILANVLGAGMILPQVLRLRRASTSEGLSAVGVGVGIALNLWWVTYGLQADGAFSIVPVSIAGVILYTVITFQLVQLGTSEVLGPIAGGFFTVGVMPILPYLLVGLEAAGLTIGLLYGVQFAPAALAAMRSDRLVGVSTATWSMALVEAAIWLVYGLHIGDPALAVGGVGGSFMAGVILLRLRAVRAGVQPRFAM